MGKISFEKIFLKISLSDLLPFCMLSFVKGTGRLTRGGYYELVPTFPQNSGRPLVLITPPSALGISFHLSNYPIPPHPPSLTLHTLLVAVRVFCQYGNLMNKLHFTINLLHRQTSKYSEIPL